MPFPVTSQPLLVALTERDYLEPTPVQSAVLDPAAADRDLLVSAQTGSGKTVAYGLALASTLLGEAEFMGQAAEPVALIVAPTRELAQQVHRELQWLYAKAGARVVACVGGMDIRRERRQLSDGAHIVVGTPGRLRDHIEKGHFDTTQMKAVVLDEADEMLDLGFREDLEFILEQIPAERRTLLFSATMPKPIAALAKKFQRDSLRIDVSSSGESHADIEYRAIRLAPNEVEHGVVNILRFIDARAAIVFCHTRDSVRHLHANLSERGFSVVALSGELSQSDRNHALQALRDGRARVCVATDVAARGIDLPGLDLVIHAELPSDRDTLLHRSGRTGRAGRKGLCVVLVPYPRRRKAEMLFSAARIDVTWGAAPSADEIRALDQKRMLEDPVLTEEFSEEDLGLGRALLADRSSEEVAAALVRLYRSRLPAPEELIDAGDTRDRGPRDRYEPRERPDRGQRPERDFQRGQGRDDRGPRREDREPSAPRDHEAFGEGVWFRMNVGRANNADPRWLLPLICRIGHVTKKDVGAIRISDNETRFSIQAEMAGKFAGAVRRSGDEEVRIEPVPPEGGLSGPGPKTRSGKPYRAEKSYQQVKRTEGAAPGERSEHKPRRPEGAAPAFARADAPPREQYKPRDDRPRPPKRDFRPRDSEQGVAVAAAPGAVVKPKKKKKPNYLPE
jgi:ATP-dependent RNA helicase DeaD